MVGARFFFADWSWDTSRSVFVLEATDGRFRLLAPRPRWLPNLGFWVATYVPILMIVTDLVVRRDGGWPIGLEIATRVSLGLLMILLGFILWTGVGPRVVGQRSGTSLDIRVLEVQPGLLTQQWTIGWEDNLARILVWRIGRPLGRPDGGTPDVT